MAEKDQRISGLRSGGDDYITKPYDVDELRERVAANYLSKQRGHTFRITANYINDKRYCRAKNLLTTEDMFCADFLYNRIPNELDPFDYNAFEKSDTADCRSAPGTDARGSEEQPTRIPIISWKILE